MINSLLFILEDAVETVPSLDTSAVDKVMEWVNKIMSTPIFTIGGTTLTVGLLIVALIKFFFPKNKIIAEQEVEIASLKAENNLLKEDAERTEARLSTLEQQMNVVLINNPNKRVRDARQIRVDRVQKYSRNENIDYRGRRRKRYRVKVKKAVEQVEEIANKIESEVIPNGN